MAYHYTESGLDYVYLVNGYQIHETPYGKGVSIQDTDGLHKLIARLVVSTPKALTGAELRFLRVEMDLSQRNLAAIIGTEEQNVFRWEKSRKKEIPGPADRLLRGLYSEYAGGDGSIRRMCERLSDLDQIESPVLKVVDTEHGWDVECAA